MVGLSSFDETCMHGLHARLEVDVFGPLGRYVGIKFFGLANVGEPPGQAHREDINLGQVKVASGQVGPGIDVQGLPGQELLADRDASLDVAPPSSNCPLLARTGRGCLRNAQLGLQIGRRSLGGEFFVDGIRLFVESQGFPGPTLRLV